jgi:hypothetical protein
MRAARKVDQNLEALCREADIADHKVSDGTSFRWNASEQNLEVADLKTRA